MEREIALNFLLMRHTELAQVIQMKSYLRA